MSDRRGMGGPMAVGGGVLGVLALIITALMGGNVDLSQLQELAPAEPLSAEQQAHEDELAQFVSVVLKETEDVWSAEFAARGGTYQAPTLVLFRGAVSSACGSASAAMGPFYCPGDHQLYVDLSFYDELRERFGAPGDFAMAYVVAHEVGHHVQTLLGTTSTMERMRAQARSAEEVNAASVRFELQADFLAGVWAHHTARKDLLEQGDLEEALTAAAAVGDDRIARNAGASVSPESFTHGTSEQRMYWFKKGFTSGSLEAGDTFASQR